MALHASIWVIKGLKGQGVDLISDETVVEDTFGMGHSEYPPLNN